MNTEHLVVGAGVAGLACAQALTARGHSVVVLDREDVPGGRCSTVTIDGQPVDMGPAFLHGSDPAFVDAIRALSTSSIEGWPQQRAGSGHPSRYDAFRPGEQRWAFREGVGVLVRSLAAGLDLRLGERVSRVSCEDGAVWTVASSSGATFQSKSLVLAVPCEAISELLRPVSESLRELHAAVALVDLVTTLPCLTLAASYPLTSPVPPWDILYPEEAECLMLVSHDSAKRPDPSHRVLVMQARSGWSRKHMTRPASEWIPALLEDAKQWVGEWVGKPEQTLVRTWNHARLDRGNELAGPMWIDLPQGASLGLVGDVFAPGGGVEAAWIAGNKLARRLAHEDVGS